MKKQEAMTVINKVYKDIFGTECAGDLDSFVQKYAYDIALPSEVVSTLSQNPTWTSAPGSHAYASFEEVLTEAKKHDWLFPAQTITNYAELVGLWRRTSFGATERMLESDDIHESDTIYRSQQIFRSRDIHDSKLIALCDSIHRSEMLVASQRSNESTYCIRIEDSNKCSSSYGVIWSTNIVKSLLISDCSDLFECIMCSHINGKKYCIANMQFSEEEYFKLKPLVIAWLMD